MGRSYSMKELKGSVYAVISAIIFGCMPIVAKYLYAEGCNPVSLVVYRYSLALPGSADIGIEGTGER